MSRWLVAGAGGMLGQDLVEVLRAAGHEVTPARRGELDITDPAACAAVVDGHDIVVNAAAWTAVDDAETHEAQAFAVNAVGAANLAGACAARGARLVHVSTDYVFDGEATSPYAEDAPVAPRSAYGRTKAAGEWAVRAQLPGASWVVRTAWLHGRHGPSFVRTMLRLERERDTVEVVDDQVGQPTWSLDLARQIEAMARVGAPPGTYHGTASGQTTWFGLAREVFALAGADPDRVRPTTTDRFPRPAPRPAWSVLGHDAWRRAGMEPLHPWRESLPEAVAALTGAGG